MKNSTLVAKALTLCILTSLFTCFTTEARQLYLATDGDDNNTGTTETQPFATLTKALTIVMPGDTIWVHGGTYEPDATINIKQTGTKDARICLFAVEGEKPVFDFCRLEREEEDVAKNNRGIMHQIGANYWHYRGIEFCNAPDNALKLEGSFCVVEECVFHDNGDTGLQQGFGKGDNGENTRNPEFKYGRYNIVLNCDSYNNCDVWSNGGDADGFAVKLFPGPGNEFHGCRSWYNSDDGWDFYYTVYPIVVDNCWTLNNGYNKGNGNGFKMGGSNDKKTSFGAHIFTRCISADNASKGFDQNNHNEGTYLFNCVSVRNGINYGFNNAIPEYGNWVLRNCIGFAGEERNHQFNYKDSPSEPRADIQYCSWTTLDHCSPYNDRDGSDPYTGETGYSKSTTDRSNQFVSLTYEDALAARQADGSLPLKFGRLKEGSDFIDAGVIIDKYDAADIKNPEYGRTITLQYNGSTADMGAFEYGIDNNEYTLVYPENDGSVDDEEPDDPYADFKDENGNIVYSEKILSNWYPFQDAVLPDSIAALITGGTWSVKPEYAGNGTVAYTGCTTGALAISKNGTAEFTVPSLHAFQMRMYITGGRTLKVESRTVGETSWNEQNAEYKKGSYTVDIAAMAMKSKDPVEIRITNIGTGDMHITDLYISGYEYLNGYDNVTDVKTTEIDFYLTRTALICYGETVAINVYDLNGRKVASSRNMQVVDIASLPTGIYIATAYDKAGNRNVLKFVKK